MGILDTFKVIYMTVMTLKELVAVSQIVSLLSVL